jgi:VanZ family protein
MKIISIHYLNIFLKISTWVWLLTIAYLSLTPQVNTPITFNHIDKILHLGSYALATLLILTSFPKNNKNIILLFLYSLFMEIGQLFVKNRFFEINDLIANLAGILIMTYIFNKFLRTYLRG